jgi:hypothetical protein
MTDRDGREPVPRPGIYRHFKGNYYRVLDIASHSETGEPHVVYRALYGERGLWIRPLSLFAAPVPVAGEPRPRFEFVAGPEAPDPT